jgi:hypothetical protein
MPSPHALIPEAMDSFWSLAWLLSPTGMCGVNASPLKGDCQEESCTVLESGPFYKIKYAQGISLDFSVLTD